MLVDVALAVASPAPVVSDTTGGDPSTSISLADLFSFAQFGLLGIFFVMLISKKWVVPKWTLDDLKESHARELQAKDEVVATQKADIAELKATVTELQDLTRDRMIPALVQANALSAAYVAELSRRASTPLSPGALGD